MATLIIQNGPLEGTRIALRSGMVIGREPAPEVDIALRNSRVSGRHACIEQVEQGTWYLRDLGSTNGTRVNGAACQHTALHHGVEVAFAEIVATFEEALPVEPVSALRTSPPSPPTPAQPQLNSPPPISGPQPGMSQVKPSEDMLLKLRSGADMLRRRCDGGDGLVAQLKEAITKLDRVVSQSDPDRTLRVAERLVAEDGDLAEVAQDLQILLETFDQTLTWFEDTLAKFK